MDRYSHSHVTSDPFRRSALRRGFTLLEMIVVIAIIGIMAALALPAISGVKHGLDLNTGASQLLDQLAFARQLACVRNMPVEVRLYCSGAPGPETPDSLAMYLVLADGSARQIQKRFKLPMAVQISRNEQFSSLLSESYCGQPFVKTGDNEKSQSFRFLPNGMTSLNASDSPTLTLMLRKDDKGETLPSNFVTLQINLQTGRIQTFRP